MIKNFRRNIIFITATSLILVLGFTMLMLNILTRSLNKRSADKIITRIYESYDNIDNIDFNAPLNIITRDIQPSGDSLRNKSFFFTIYDENNKVIDFKSHNIADLSEVEMIEISNEVNEKRISKGYEEIYRYNIKPLNDGKIIIFIDSFNDLYGQNLVMRLCLIIGMAMSIMVILVVGFMSKRVIRPFIDNEKKQRHFITDASHELKTPLSIISANTEMIEIINGESEWTDSTKDQVYRMERLIKNFIALSKSDEAIQENIEQVDFSELVIKVCRDFKGRAEIIGKTIKSEIEPGIIIEADYEQLQQVVNILVDNAIKYSQDDNMIIVNLNKIKKVASLKVGNKIENFTKEDEKKIFNRFYRTDNSRSRDTGGFGLGLSIAAKIINAYGGKVSSKYKDSWLFFTIEIPIKQIN